MGADPLQIIHQFTIEPVKCVCVLVRLRFRRLTVVAGLPGDHNAVRLRAVVGQQLHLHVLGAPDVVLALVLPEQLSTLPGDATLRESTV